MQRFIVIFVFFFIHLIFLCILKKGIIIMKTMIYSFIFIFCFAAIGASVAQDSAAPERLKPAQLVSEALEKNQSLEAARLDYKSKNLMVRPARALPDPMIEFGVMSVPINTFSLNREDMTQKIVGVTQVFPYPGKLRLAEAAAQSDADAMNLQIRVYEENLKFEVRRTFYEWAYSVEAKRITESNLTEITLFTQIAMQRYSLGAGTQWDILDAQLEQSKLNKEIRTLSQNISSFQAMMAGLLGRNAKVDGVPAVDFTPTLKLDETELIRRADEKNPVLIYMRAIAAAADKATEAARRERYPNFSVNLSYGQRSNGEMNGVTVKRPDFVSLIFGVEAPIYSKRKQIPLADSAETTGLAIRKMIAEKTLMIHAAIRDKMSRIKNADDIEELYRTGILPQARTAAKSALASYQVSKVDFMALRTSQISLLNYELEYYEIRINREIDIAGLELLIGETISKQ